MGMGIKPVMGRKKGKMKRRDFKITEKEGKWKIVKEGKESVEYKKKEDAELVVGNILAGIDRTFDLED